MGGREEVEGRHVRQDGVQHVAVERRRKNFSLFFLIFFLHLDRWPEGTADESFITEGGVFIINYVLNYYSLIKKIVR